MYFFSFFSFGSGRGGDMATPLGVERRYLT